MDRTGELKRSLRISHPALMLTLTFCTGICDAIGYLALDRVFTGNMTGNVVILGMAIGQADDLPIAGPLIALVTFVVFAGIGGRVVRRHPDGWPTPVSAIFGVVAVALAAVAVWSAFIGRTGSAHGDDRSGHHRRRHGLAGRCGAARGSQGHHDRGGHLSADRPGR
ncbi:MAG: YoaK family protein [Dietzia sp.]|nr:YoaK family protein [Dietzia sp.]